MDELIYIHAFNILFFGNRKLMGKISEKYNGFQNGFQKVSEKWFLENKIEIEKFSLLKDWRNNDFLFKEKDWLNRNSVELIGRESEEFQFLEFADIDKPFLLYRKGSPLNNREKIAIVGTRKCSNEGGAIAQEIAEACSREGISIVSGMARGIDSFAHWGAISHNAPTIAVLGEGFANLKSNSNFQIAKKIMDSGGTLITEYFPNQSARKHSFLERNRIISALCKGVIIIEADFRSGALNTAKHALEQGKMVWAVPGNIKKIQSRGCNNLIKKGEAALFSEIEDLTEIYQISKLREEENLANENQQIVFNLIKENGETDENFLLENSGLDRSELILALTDLEIAGVVRQEISGYWSI